jgi:hypothetical protein
MSSCNLITKLAAFIMMHINCSPDGVTSQAHTTSLVIIYMRDWANSSRVEEEGDRDRATF